LGFGERLKDKMHNSDDDAFYALTRSVVLGDYTEVVAFINDQALRRGRRSLKERADYTWTMCKVICEELEQQFGAPREED
jgi:hypothetical protein